MNTIKISLAILAGVGVYFVYADRAEKAQETASYSKCVEENEDLKDMKDIFAGRKTFASEDIMSQPYKDCSKS